MAWHAGLVPHGGLSIGKFCRKRVSLGECRCRFAMLFQGRKNPFWNFLDIAPRSGIHSSRRQCSALTSCGTPAAVGDGQQQVACFLPGTGRLSCLVSSRRLGGLARLQRPGALNPQRIPVPSGKFGLEPIVGNRYKPPQRKILSGFPADNGISDAWILPGHRDRVPEKSP